MKKIICSLSVCLLATGAFAAEDALNRVLPLLQKNYRTAEDTRQVLQVFRTAQQADVIFAAGASLAKTPPSADQENSLFTLLTNTQNPLKQVFCAVIITAMGGTYEELIPLLQNALNGKDPVLRAYAAAAYTLLRPQDTSYTTDVIRLYIFDPSLAARALNLVSATDQSPFKLLKQASSNTDEQVRAASAAWLSDLHTQQAAQQLLKMAKKEKAPSVQAALARGLAAQAQYTLPQLTKGLYKSYRSAYANTCALSLGFMTGNATEVLRQMLSTTHPNARINASRAAAYMANVLASSEGFAYSSDRTFDIHLLKGLIAPLNLIAQTGNDTERTYADNALRQIEKLME